MFSLIGTVIIGFIVGLLARAVMPGTQKMGFIMTTLLGIVGSFVAGYAARLLGGTGQSVGFIASVLGAIAVLWVYLLITKK